tara:strand:+ start:295 stop:621 length:327 start_codon:yes stop_codon:yes gene_type:complete
VIELLRFELGAHSLALRLDSIERFLEPDADLPAEGSLPESLGLPASEGVLVEVGGRRVALGARGAVQQVAADALTPLPPPLSAHPAITGLVLLGAAAPLLLVDPGRVS